MQLVFRGVGCARSAGMRAASGALRPARRSAKRLLPTERKRAELPVGYAYKKSARRICPDGHFFFSAGVSRRGFSYFYGLYRLLAVHRAAAVDHLPADIRREIRREEQRDLGHILGRTAAAERDLLVPAFLHLVGQLVGHLGHDEARGDGVGADAARAHLLGDRLGQADHAGLRGRIVTLARVAADTHHRRHVDDRTALLAGHNGRHGMDEVERLSLIHI